MKEIDLVKFSTAAAVECVRQQVDIASVANLLWAAWDLQRYAYNEFRLIHFQGIARVIVPETCGEFRKVPAHFANMQFATHPSTIPSAMDALFDFPRIIAGLKKEVDDWVKDFLEIHPLDDGNGRSAWLMRVWLLDQWDDPEPLPDYFTQKEEN